MFVFVFKISKVDNLLNQINEQSDKNHTMIFTMFIPNIEIAFMGESRPIWSLCRLPPRNTGVGVSFNEGIWSTLNILIASVNSFFNNKYYLLWWQQWESENFAEYSSIPLNFYILCQSPASPIPSQKDSRL